MQILFFDSFLNRFWLKMLNIIGSTFLFNFLIHYVHFIFYISGSGGFNAFMVAAIISVIGTVYVWRPVIQKSSHKKTTEDPVKVSSYLKSTTVDIARFIRNLCPY